MGTATIPCPPCSCLVCMSHHSTADAACGGFAAERRAGRRYRSTAAAATAPQHGAASTELSSKCEQCHVNSPCRKLNTNLVNFASFTSSKRSLKCVDLSDYVIGHRPIGFFLKVRCYCCSSQPACNCPVCFHVCLLSCSKQYK